MLVARIVAHRIGCKRSGQAVADTVIGIAFPLGIVCQPADGVVGIGIAVPGDPVVDIVIGVIGFGKGDISGIRMPDPGQVTAGIVSIGGSCTVGIGKLGPPARGVISQGEAAGEVADTGKPSRIVLIGDRAGEGISHSGQAIVGIVGKSVGNILVGGRKYIAVLIIAEGRYGAVGIAFLQEPSGDIVYVGNGPAIRFCLGSEIAVGIVGEGGAS
ncbi:MAG: hypothetical protein A4E66_00657 [Syntrophus sp. PtaB.Bin001]|nr:MAG: hypothetical protein A4E66_00657 [Syntrophus sp. PtaB.Bin001]